MPTVDRGRTVSRLAEWEEAGSVRAVDVASWAGVGLPAVYRLRAGDLHTRLWELWAVSAALGLAPVEIFPDLARRPADGELRRRGVLRK